MGSQPLECENQGCDRKRGLLISGRVMLGDGTPNLQPHLLVSRSQPSCLFLMILTMTCFQPQNNITQKTYHFRKWEFWLCLSPTTPQCLPPLLKELILVFPRVLFTRSNQKEEGLFTKITTNFCKFVWRNNSRNSHGNGCCIFELRNRETQFVSGIFHHGVNALRDSACNVLTFIVENNSKCFIAFGWL